MRVRLRYTEHGPIRFLGHRDLARCWERAIRRAELPIAYSEGFSPRPKMHFGLALSVGHDSEAEYLDLDFRHDVDVSALPALLSPLLPEGVDVTAAVEVSRSDAALQAAVDVVIWRFTFDHLDATELAGAAAALMAQDALVVPLVRKGSTIQADVRPALIRLEAESAVPDGSTLWAELATRPRAIRPGELLTLLDLGEAPRLVTRQAQLMTIDGQLVAPIELTSRPDAPPQRLAS